MFAAHAVSVFSGFRQVLFRFSLFDDLNPAIKFNPKYFLLQSQGATSAHRHIPVRFRCAWLSPFGIFLFLMPEECKLGHVFFVSHSNLQSALLRMCLNRLRSEELLEKPSLTSYFWRINVLR